MANGHKVNTFRLGIRKRYFIIETVIRIMVPENQIAFKRALSTFKENIS